MAIARFTLAVDRRGRRQDGADQQTADFIGCVAFGRQAEFAEKYLRQGTKVAVTGRIQTGSYTNKDGQKVYTTDVVLDDIEFAESKNAQGGGDSNYSYQAPQRPAPSAAGDGFMNIPDGIDEELPFN
jgi:single-strand DNA-binding protein